MLQVKAMLAEPVSRDTGGPEAAVSHSSISGRHFNPLGCCFFQPGLRCLCSLPSSLAASVAGTGHRHPDYACQLWGYALSLQHCGEVLGVIPTQNPSICTAKPENTHRMSQVKMDCAREHPWHDNSTTHRSHQPGRQPWVLILLPSSRQPSSMLDGKFHSELFPQGTALPLPSIDPAASRPALLLPPAGQSRGMPGPAGSC